MPPPVLTIKQLASVSVPWQAFRARFGPLVTSESIIAINRQVVIATLIDWYDGGAYDYAFTSTPAAVEFCRRHERSLVELCRPVYKNAGNFLKAFLADGFYVPPREKYPEYSKTAAWTSRKDDIAWFITHPASRRFEINHQEVLDQFGCGTTWESYLEEERRRGRPEWVRDCWCAGLRQGILPKDAPHAHARNFDYERAEDLFETEPHDGRARKLSCKVCGGIVIQLSLNVPGFGDSSHAYYSFPLEEDLAGMTPQNYEAYVNSHAGIHCDGWFCTFYDKTKVYDLGFEVPEGAD